jgi:hypothetical protein
MERTEWSISEKPVATEINRSTKFASRCPIVSSSGYRLLRGKTTNTAGSSRINVHYNHLKAHISGLKQRDRKLFQL